MGVASPPVWGVGQQQQQGARLLLLLQGGHPPTQPPMGAHQQGGLQGVVGVRAALLLQVLPAAAAAGVAALLLLGVLPLGAGRQGVRGLHHCCRWPEAVIGWVCLCGGGEGVVRTLA